MRTEAALGLGVGAAQNSSAASALAGWRVMGLSGGAYFATAVAALLKAPMMREVLAVSTSTQRW
jgi:hypothetical protein